MSEENLSQTETEKPKPIPKTRKRKQLRTFTVVRLGDESGVSGIGRVLNGVVFHDDSCIIRWCSEVPSSVSYDSFEDFERVHITSHPENKSEIVWGDNCFLNEKVAELRKKKGDVSSKDV